MATHLSGPVYSTNGFVGAVTGSIIGTVTGAIAGNQVGTHYDSAAPTAYPTGSAEAIDPSVAVAALTKATTGTYTLAAPGASNLYKTITVYSTSTGQHVTTVAGCLGGTTMTMAAAIGTSFSLYAVSTAAWSVVSLNGVTQS